MNDINKCRKIASALTKIALILFGVLVFFAFRFGNYESTEFGNDIAVNSHDKVIMKGAGAVDTPFKIKAKKGQQITFIDTIPEDTKDGDVIMVQSLYSKVIIRVDGVKIGSYGTVRPLSVGWLIGNIRVIAPLEESMAGKEVEIEVTPYYSADTDFHSPIYGSRYMLLSYVFDLNFGRIIIVTMMLTLLLVVMGLMTYQRITNSNINRDALIYFGHFVALVAAWIICSSDIPQFFTSANEGISLVSFICLSMMGVAYMGFCESVFDNGTQVFVKIRMFGWLLPILNIMCFFLGICDPMTLLPLTHLYFVIVAVVSLYYAVEGYKKHMNNRLMCYAIIELIVFASIGLVLYFITPSQGYDAYAFGTGLLIFFFLLLVVIMRKLVKMVEQEKEMSTFKALAYADALTGLDNRSSFERFFDKLDINDMDGKSITLFMFDLNYLKVTNDKFGHKAGDELLCGLASSIEHTFEKIGTSYRLGGDEFAAIVVGRADQTLNIVESLKKNIDAYNKYHEHKVSTAIGYASGKYHEGEVDFYDKLFREADDVMYANKVRCHKEEGQEVRDKKDI